MNITGSRLLAHLGLGVATLGLVCACGSGATSSASSSPASASSGSASSGSAPALVRVEDSASLGAVLVDSAGRTIYDFGNDTAGASTCEGSCVTNWPIVEAPAALPHSLPGVTGKLGVLSRADGGRQLTIDGRPVYTFIGDTAPGQANGQGKVLRGGMWTVVDPAGHPVENPAPAPSGGDTY